MFKLLIFLIAISSAVFALGSHPINTSYLENLNNQYGNPSISEAIYVFNEKQNQIVEGVRTIKNLKNVSQDLIGTTNGLSGTIQQFGQFNFGGQDNVELEEMVPIIPTEGPFKEGLNESFSKSKKELESKVYSKLKKETIYCGCSFDTNKKIGEGCSFKSDKFKNRKDRIEWEHVVPAENFGRTFLAWREGDPECESLESDEYYKGRLCATKVSRNFRIMQADPYNLYPSVGAANAIRSNYQIVEIPGEKRNFGDCDFEIEDHKVEPRDSMKGDIARVHLYMQKHYRMGLISDKTEKIIRVWSSEDPVSKEECDRYRTIKDVFGQDNEILKPLCKKIN